MATVRVKSKKTAAPELDERIVEFAKHKEAAKYHEGQWREAQPSIIEQMEEAGSNRRIVDTDDAKVTATIVRGTTVNLDSDRLKKAIGARAWNKLTVRSLDQKKVKEAIESGDLDPNIVAECSDEVDKTPYVRTSVKHL